MGRMRDGRRRGHAGDMGLAIGDTPPRGWREPDALAGRPAVIAGVLAPRLWRLAWPLLIVALTIAAMMFGRAHRGAFPPAALALSALATAPLLGIRRWPFPAVAIATAADVVFVVYARLSWAPAAVVAWLLTLALCPLLLRRVHAVTVLVVSEAAVLAAAVVPAAVNPRPWDAPVTEALAALLMWGTGETLRARREGAAHRVVVARQLRELQEREVLASAQAAIARELHDVVAHHVSLIAVRAAMAPYQLSLTPDSRTVLDEIAAQARTALSELRTVLGVLRSPDGPASRTPPPRLADLPDLVERMRSSGMRVVVDTDGSPRGLSDRVELCCYRVVQEALTNAARHAPGEPVTLTVRYGPDVVALVIVNGTPSGWAPSGSGPGLGLIGMRERVTTLGGTLAAGRDINGFKVEAVIPTVRALLQR
jgi:signal transduction histidine kinase